MPATAKVSEPLPRQVCGAEVTVSVKLDNCAKPEIENSRKKSSPKGILAGNVCFIVGDFAINIVGLCMGKKNFLKFNITAISINTLPLKTIFFSQC